MSYQRPLSYKPDFQLTCQITKYYLGKVGKGGGGNFELLSHVLIKDDDTNILITEVNSVNLT